LKTCMSPFQKGSRLYWLKTLGQHHINKETCTVSVVFSSFCPTLVYLGLKRTTEKVSECVTLNSIQKKKYSVVLSPLANYTDRAIAAGQRS
jgi:hypothetical protein